MPFQPHGGSAPPPSSPEVVAGAPSGKGGSKKGLLALIGVLVVAGLAAGAYFLFIKDDDDNKDNNEVVVGNSAAGNSAAGNNNAGNTVVNNTVVNGTAVVVAADGTVDTSSLTASVKAILDKSFPNDQAGIAQPTCPLGDIQAFAAKAPAALNAVEIAKGGQINNTLKQKTARVVFCRGTSADEQSIGVFAGDPYDSPSHNQGVEDAFNASAPHDFVFGTEEDFNGGKLQPFCATEKSSGKVTCRADWFNDDIQFGVNSNAKGVTEAQMVEWFKAIFNDMAAGIVTAGGAAAAGSTPATGG